MKREGFRLEINRCPIHSRLDEDSRLQGYWSIAASDGERGGIRLTSSKCCGQWETVKKFSVDPWQLVVDIVSEARSLTQEQSFDLMDRIRGMMPERDEEFKRPR